MRQHLDQLWRQVYPDGTPCPTVRPGDIRSRVNAALDAAPSERRQPMRHKTRFAAILTAAAVALGSTALAVTVQWDVLDAFFRGDTSPAETLVDRQAPSANDENYTFTVESSVSDGDTAYLVVRVDALTEDAAVQLYSKYFLNMDTFSVYPVADPEEPIPEDLGVDEQTGCNIPARNAMSMGIREIKQAATQTSRTWQLDVSLDSNEAANYLHARLCYMNRACTIALPLSPAESVTLDIGASGPGSPTSENTQGGTITLESVTLSPFTCQIAARHEDGNKEVDPLIFFLLEDGTLRTSGQLLFHSKTSYHSDGTADYSYQFQEVLDLSQLSAVVFDGTAYPLDGGAAYGVEVDPRLYPFQLPLMDRLSEDSGLALPLEALYEALGASYTWDGEAQTAVCSYRGVTLELTVGSRTALVNGVPVALEDAPTLQNGILAVGNDISDFLGLNTFVVYNTEEDGFLDYLCWIVIP